MVTNNSTQLFADTCGEMDLRELQGELYRGEEELELWCQCARYRRHMVGRKHSSVRTRMIADEVKRRERLKQIKLERLIGR
jgi:hypothetical protein